MKTDYTGYTTEKLLQDDYFIHTILHPVPETELFWKQLLKEGKIKQSDFELAVFFLRSLRVKKQYMSPEAVSSLWENIEIKNKNRLNRKVRQMYRLLLPTACGLLLLLLGVSYLYLYPHEETPTLMSVARSLKPEKETEEVQLLLSHNQQIFITGQEAKIDYKSSEEIQVNTQTIKLKTDSAAYRDATLQPMRYNQLVVPVGKRSTLILQDSTKLWVNSGSRIVYPVVFASGQREIYIEGEVYLEVAPDKKRPFLVKTTQMDIKVLGTSFNVTAYENDTVKSVVLVTGSVKVETRNQQVSTLAPDHLFTYTHGTASIQKVEAGKYISWKDGIYNYESESLAVILKRLSRYYGKEITYEPAVSSLKCTGKLDIKDDLETVLSGLMLTAPIYYIRQEGRYLVALLPAKE
ncbi:FecR family protein [Parabacteroides pacaensis]|uniref:FecR family protein n=1 Tax=Parabacteroides pacaensis TaxID=2086575 RepID=UPI000D0F88DA|nr:FecR domain-containing protein [Parabacteroides pacaensis]